MSGQDKVKKPQRFISLRKIASVFPLNSQLSLVKGTDLPKDLASKLEIELLQREYFILWHTNEILHLPTNLVSHHDPELSDTQNFQNKFASELTLQQSEGALTCQLGKVWGCLPLSCINQPLLLSESLFNEYPFFQYLKLALYCQLPESLINNIEQNQLKIEQFLRKHALWHMSLAYSSNFILKALRQAHLDPRIITSQDEADEKITSLSMLVHNASIQEFVSDEHELVYKHEYDAKNSAGVEASVFKEDIAFKEDFSWREANAFKNGTVTTHKHDTATTNKHGTVTTNVDLRSKQKEDSVDESKVNLFVQRSHNAVWLLGRMQQAINLTHATYSLCSEVAQSQQDSSFDCNKFNALAKDNDVSTKALQQNWQASTSIRQLSGADLQKATKFMQLALQEAHKAASLGEVPVGAVLVDELDQIVAQGYNRTITDFDITAHAEMVAFRQAGQVLANHRLNNLTLYVTLEPCCMCAMAAIHARVKRVVFGAREPKTGACGSQFNLALDPRHNHRLELYGGVLQDECREILQEFFAQRRS